MATASSEALESSEPMIFPFGEPFSGRSLTGNGESERLACGRELVRRGGGTDWKNKKRGLSLVGLLHRELRLDRLMRAVRIMPRISKQAGFHVRLQTKQNSLCAAFRLLEGWTFVPFTRFRLEPCTARDREADLGGESRLNLSTPKCLCGSRAYE